MLGKEIEDNDRCKPTVQKCFERTVFSAAVADFTVYHIETHEEYL
jgi:hypothetical protein